jgi:hypothetical protein
MRGFFADMDGYGWIFFLILLQYSKNRIVMNDAKASRLVTTVAFKGK